MSNRNRNTCSFVASAPCTLYKVRSRAACSDNHIVASKFRGQTIWIVPRPFSIKKSGVASSKTLCMVLGNILDPKLGTRQQVQPRVIRELPQVGEHPARELIRKFKEIPVEKFYFKEWFTNVMTYMAMKEYNAYAADAILKVLLQFAETSDIHRTYMSEFIKQSSFSEIYQQRMYKVFRGRINHKHIGNVIRHAGLLKMRLSEQFLLKWFEVALTHRDKKRLKKVPELFERYRALPSFQHQQLASTMRGFGELNIRPPGYFMEQWFEAFVREERFHQGNSLADCIWGLAVLKITPPFDFVESWCQALESQCQKSLYRARIDRYSLGVSLWSFAKLGIRPKESTIKVWLKAMIELIADGRRTYPASFAHATADAIWAMGKLGISFPEPMLLAYYYRFALEKNELQAASLTNIIWAYGRLCPPTTPELIQHLSLWCSAFRREDVYIRRYFSASQLSKMAWAFGRLSVVMDDETLYSWYEAFGREKNNFTAMELSNLFWMFGKLRLMPEKEFWEAWCGRFASLPPSDFASSDLASIMYALGRLKMVPSDLFMERWVECYDMIDCVSESDWKKISWGFEQISLDPPKSKTLTHPAAL